MNEKLTPEQLLDRFINKAIDMYGKDGKLMIADACNILSSLLPATEPEDECKCPECGDKVNEHKVLCPIGVNSTNPPEDERYQTALEVQAEYLKELNKYSKEKSWEEGQSQSGLFMWLGMKLQQEDE